MMILALAATMAWQDLSEVDRGVAAVARSEGTVATPIDKRLRLARCPEALVVERAEAQALAVRCPALGWRIRVRLQGAAASLAPLVQDAPVVRRGDPVTLALGGQGFAIETSGVATEDGRLGAVVRVKLDGGTRITSGVVTGPGTVAAGALK